jgi:hypothetical protein
VSRNRSLLITIEKARPNLSPLLLLNRDYSPLLSLSSEIMDRDKASLVGNGQVPCQRAATVDGGAQV